MNDEGKMSQIEAMAKQLDAAHDEIAKLRAALEESVKLQSHYAMLVNVYDSGKRMQFDNADAWLIRLAALADEQEVQIIAAAKAMMEAMFAPHELPLDEELQRKYRDTAAKALVAANKAADRYLTPINR
jgi:hypothetical protein